MRETRHLQGRLARPYGNTAQKALGAAIAAATAIAGAIGGHCQRCCHSAGGRHTSTDCWKECAEGHGQGRHCLINSAAHHADGSAGKRRQLSSATVRAQHMAQAWPLPLTVDDITV